jgi:hypothetical protein
MHSSRSAYLHVSGLRYIRSHSDMHKIHLRGFSESSLDTYKHIHICLNTFIIHIRHCMYPNGMCIYDNRLVVIRYTPGCILCISMCISVCIIFSYCTDASVHICAVSAKSYIQICTAGTCWITDVSASTQRQQNPAAPPARRGI